MDAPKTKPTRADTAKTAPSAQSDKEGEETVRKAIAEIDKMELSDLEIPEFAQAKEHRKQICVKRQASVREAENVKRKVSATYWLVVVSAG